MKGQNLPPDDSVVRVVPFAKLRHDEHNNVVGVDFTAFQRRDDEGGLSVTWLEYFPGNRPVKIIAAVHALRASNYKPSPKAGFAIGEVSTIAAACEDRKHRIRIIHMPEDDNKAHTEVRRLPRDDLALLEALASTAWAELVLNAEIPEGEKPAPDQPAARA